MSKPIDEQIEEMVPCWSSCQVQADPADFPMNCTCGEAVKRAGIRSLIKEARIDELTDMLYGHSRDVTLTITDKDGEEYTKEQFGFISRHEVQDRLAQLKGDKDE